MFPNLTQLNSTNEDYFNDTIDASFEDPKLECPTYDKTEDAILESLGFWIDTVVTSVLCLVGFIANIFSTLILGREDMRNSFNFLLIALICMDSGFLLASAIEVFRKLDSASWYTDSAVYNIHLRLFPYFLYPLLSIMVTGSIFMTVAIAFERFFAVHYPIDYSQAINSPDACKKRLVKYVIPVVLISILINVPKFLESQVITDMAPILKDFEVENQTLWWFNYTAGEPMLVDEEKYKDHVLRGNMDELSYLDAEYTLDEIIKKQNMKTKSFIGVTELRQNQDYVMYYTNWTRLVLIGIVPTVLLVYFNYKIYKDVKHRNRRQMSMSRTSATATQQARRKQEDNLAIVFMGIVLVFLICHTPRNILSFAETITIENAIKCQEQGMRQWPIWYLYGYHLSHLLLVINSSTNMILYIFLNKAFRLHFLNMMRSLCRCCNILTSPCKKMSANNNLGPDNHPMEPLIGANHHAKETNNDNGKLETAPPTPNAIIATTAAEQQQQPPHIIDEIEKNDEKSKITKTTTNHNPLLSNGSTIKDHNNSKSPIMTSLTILTSSPPKDNHAATEDTAKEKDGGGDDGDVAISEYIIKSSSCQ